MLTTDLAQPPARPLRQPCKPESKQPLQQTYQGTNSSARKASTSLHRSALHALSVYDAIEKKEGKNTCNQPLFSSHLICTHSSSRDEASSASSDVEGQPAPRVLPAIPSTGSWAAIEKSRHHLHSGVLPASVLQYNPAANCQRHQIQRHSNNTLRLLVVDQAIKSDSAPNSQRHFHPSLRAICLFQARPLLICAPPYRHLALFSRSRSVRPRSRAKFFRSGPKTPGSQ